MPDQGECAFYIFTQQHGLRIIFTSPGIGQQLAGQVGHPMGGFLHRLDIIHYLFIVRELHLKQPGVTRDEDRALLNSWAIPPAKVAMASTFRL